MKNIIKVFLFILLFFVIGFMMQTDYEVWQLPEYTSVVNDSTDVMYIDDSGIDKHIEMPTFLGVIHDTADQIRTEYNDSISSIRAIATSGSVGFSKSGNIIYTTDNDDSVGIGTSDPDYKLDVNGTINASMYRIGNMAALSTISSYMLVSPFTIFGNNVGINTGKVLYLDYSTTDYSIRAYGGELLLKDPSAGEVSLSELVSSSADEVITNMLSYNPLIPIFEPVPQLGRTYYSSDDSVLYICNDGTTWTELGSGGGTGVVDTAGGQDNTYVAYWVDKDILDGEPALAYNATDNELTVGNVITTEGLYLNQFNTDVSDTVATILYKKTGLVDTATLVDAAAGWEIDLIPYREFYNESWLREALPLPYPNLGTDEAHGQERRQINAKFAYYQIEFELERIHRYLHRFWIQKNWMWVIIGLLVCGFIYQQVQINKLKKNA